MPCPGRASRIALLRCNASYVQVWRRRHGVTGMLRAPDAHSFRAIKRALPHALLGRSLADDGPIWLLHLSGFGAAVQEVSKIVSGIVVEQALSKAACAPHVEQLCAAPLCCTLSGKL